MHRLRSVIATLLLLAGPIWQWGKIFLDWVGRVTAMGDLSQVWPAAHAWLSAIIPGTNVLVPWLLTVMGGISLVVTHGWPVLRKLRHPLEIVFDVNSKIFCEFINVEYTEWVVCRVGTKNVSEKTVYNVSATLRDDRGGISLNELRFASGEYRCDIHPEQMVLVEVLRVTILEEEEKISVRMPRLSLLIASRDGKIIQKNISEHLNIPVLKILHRAS